ncbi:asparagine--tRNA ligase [Psychroserpens ponticola]|uniref:Asparagine--tRNA ligase n=1 Tax=Psychroserpens ponticola TaxID=2932268 RepID=A0ABY7RXW2_9FLAO|nr:asparagine--tRNA ligase [Psychroserpens ponticola]WCO01979.1 asparagine--tRNA ligase [Psychroserpens ponticola]
MTYSVSQLLTQDITLQPLEIKGWVRTFRANRFIALNDGSTINNIQCVVDFENTDEALLKRITTGSAVHIKGNLVKSQGKGQNVEIQVTSIEILGDSDPDEYPIQPRKHGFEFLRKNAHLRTRTSTFSAVMRLRSSLSFAIHKYFNENGFYYMHTPIVTGSDAEGAGEMFKVSALDAKNPPLTKDGDIDYSQDFFGKETNLTVSGQLEAETYAMSLGKVYTFGPTFRAENSNTSRHLAEFWMIEPEVAFMDLAGNMDLAENFMKSVLSYVLEHNREDLEFLEKRLLDEEKTKPQAERSEMSLIDKIKFVVDNNFKRVSYTEAIDILKNSKPNKKKKFKYIIEEWGADLQSEHERFLVEKHFKCPVILFDYPANIKAFYMRLNEDGKTVRAMDILFPGIGEMVGGSQREERLDVLKEKMKALDIDEKELWWYLDLRKYGTAVHSGFGLGFERLVMFATGMGNIRDVIPYPRTPQNAEF